MPQTAIPYLFLRGGTSRGPYFNRADLPEDREQLAEVLMSAVGAGHAINIDGLGGGVAVTTKVAMLSRSEHEWADIDYFFAQVAVKERLVDFAPTCGNILAGVGPAAIEMGLVDASDGETLVKIHSVNTGALVESRVITPGGVVEYEGEATIAGAPGSAAPIILNFMEVIGSRTGALFPSGKPMETIDGIDVTCIDVAMPMVIARAADFGLSGYESKEELDANSVFYQRMEPIRIEAGKRMGLGDVTKSVVPKFGVLAKPRDGGAVTARYFMPWDCHPSMAVTGAICLGSCLMAPGTTAAGIAVTPNENPARLGIEHASGVIDVAMDCHVGENGFELKSAGLLRTARKLAQGQVFVPASVWGGR